MTLKKDYDRACVQIDAQAEHIGEQEKRIEKLKGEVNSMQRHWDEEQDCRGQVEHQLELCEASRRKLAEECAWTMHTGREQWIMVDKDANYPQDDEQEAIQSWIKWSEETK